MEERVLNPPVSGLRKGIKPSPTPPFHGLSLPRTPYIYNNKAVIPVKTAIQRVLKGRALRAPTSRRAGARAQPVAGATDPRNKWRPL